MFHVRTSKNTHNFLLSTPSLELKIVPNYSCMCCQTSPWLASTSVRSSCYMAHAATSITARAAGRDPPAVFLLPSPCPLVSRPSSSTDRGFWVLVNRRMELITLPGKEDAEE